MLKNNYTLINILKYFLIVFFLLIVLKSFFINRVIVKSNINYLEKKELTNQELTDLVATLQEKIEKLESEKASQSDLKIVSTVASSSTLDKKYPVGSIYMSMTEDTVEKVEAKFGGTWQKLENRFLLGASSTYEVNTTGGATSISYTPSGTVSKPTGSFTGTKATLSHTGGAVGNTTLTIDQIPSHTGHFAIGGTFSGAYIAKSNTSVFSTYGSVGRGWTIYNGNEVVPYTVSLGGGKAHNHSFTQPTAHTYTPAGSVTVSQPTFTGTTATINTMSPYITVYMYKRVS